MFNRILVAVDDSEMGDWVIEALSQLDLDPDSLVILCHIISPAELGVGQPANLAKPAGHLQQIEDRLIAYSQDIDETFERTVEIVTELVEGDPAEEIIRLAHIHQAELIILGSRGLTGVSRILQGSVSLQVVEESPCSVLVVKSSR